MTNPTTRADREAGFRLAYPGIEPIKGRLSAISLEWLERGEAAGAEVIAQTSNMVRRIAQALADERAKAVADQVTAPDLSEWGVRALKAVDELRAATDAVVEKYSPGSAGSAAGTSKAEASTVGGSTGDELGRAAASGGYVVDSVRDYGASTWIEASKTNIPNDSRIPKQPMQIKPGSRIQLREVRIVKRSTDRDSRWQDDTGHHWSESFLWENGTIIPEGSHEVCGCEESKMLRRARDASERESGRLRDVLRARAQDIDAAIKGCDALESEVKRLTAAGNDHARESEARRAEYETLREAWKVAKNDANRYEAELARAKRDWDLELEKRFRAGCAALGDLVSGKVLRMGFGSPALDELARAITERLARARREAIDSIPTFAECAKIFDGLAEVLGANLRPSNYVADVRQLKCDLDESNRQLELRRVAHAEAVRSHEEHRKAMAEQAEELRRERSALADVKVGKACDKFHDVLDRAKRIVENEIRGGR